MKTKVKRLSKRTLALMLCFLMMISALGLGTLITANAASSTYTVYFRNNGNWSNVYVLTGSNLNMSGSSGAYEDLYGSNINGFTQMTKVDGETNVYKASVTVYDNKIAFASANSTQSGYYASNGQICCVGDMTSGKICNMWTDNWKSRNGAAYKKYNLDDYTPPTSKTFYIYNKDNWSTVNYYTYNGNEAAGSWPGTAVNKSTAKIGTHEGYDVYSVTLTTTDTHIILNNGSGIQTKGNSQTSLTDGYVYSTVTSGSSTASTVYTSTSNLGLDKTISYTLGSNVNKGSTFVTNGIDNNTSAKTGTITAYYNKNVALSVTYASNYEYDSSNSSLGGATASNGNKTFTFSAVTADKTISINAKASNTALAAPTGVSLSSTSVTASENSKVTLSWNSVTNAGSYEIYKDGSKVGTSTTSSYSIERGYSYGGSYTVKAVPSDTALYSTSVASSAVTLTVTKVTLVAPTVTQSATEINYGGSVTFNLTNNNTSYTEGTDFSYKRTTAGGSTYSYTVSNLSYDTGAVNSTGTKTYKFKAVALKSDYFADSTEVSKSFTVSQASYYLTGDLVGLDSWPKDNTTEPVNTFVSNNIYSYAVTTTTTGNHYFSLTNGSGTRYQPSTSDTDMSSHNTAETAVTASTNGDWGSMYVTGVGNFIIYVNQATSGSPKVWVVKGSLSNNVTFPSSVTGQYTVQYSGQTKSYNYDDDVSFTVTPADGYRIKSVTYTPSGGSATAATTGSNNTYSFKMPAAACTISVTAVRTYTVSLTAGTGFATKQYKIGSSGTYADYSSSITVDSGSVVYFKVTYSDGYEYDSNTNLTVDTANTVFKTSAITANTSASLTAKKSTYTLTKSVTPNALSSNVTVSGIAQVGETITVSAVVPTGYALSSVKYNNNDVSMSGSGSTKTGTFTMPAANTTVTATYVAATPTISGLSMSAEYQQAHGGSYYTGDNYSVSAATDSFATLSYKLKNTTTQVETAISDPTNFTIETAGTYIIVATATNTQSGVTAVTATENTSSFTVLADSAETTKTVTAYIDFHENTVTGTPTIEINNSTAANLTKVTSDNSANVYSATVTVPYHYGPIAGNVNTPLESSFDVVVNANSNDYDFTINSPLKCITSGEVWIESQGTLGTTNVTTTRTTADGPSDANYKRIYFSKKDSTTSNIKYWDHVYAYVWGGTTTDTWDNWDYEMTWFGYSNAENRYYRIVSADTTNVIFRGRDGSYTDKGQNDGGDLNIGDKNLWYTWDGNYMGVSAVSVVEPAIYSHYSTITTAVGSTVDLTPDNATGTLTYAITSGSGTLSGSRLTKNSAGSVTVTITSTGTQGDTETTTTTVTFVDGSVTGDFSVMSYDSISTTLNSGDGVTIDSVSTKLYGTKANGSTSAIVNGGGIVTNNGNNFTATYAAPEASTGYGSLAMRVTASVTPDGDDYYFDGWYKGGNEKSTVYTSENDDIRVDGYNYTLKFSQINTYTVTITYNYKEYTAGGAYSDSGATANKTYTPDSIKFRGDITTDDCKELAVENCPNLISDYFNYRLITGNTSGYAFSASINTTNKTATVTAYLKESARKYKVYVDGTKFGNKTYTYQEEVELRAGEVGYDDDTNLNWYEGTKRMATGTSYNIRVTGDTELTTSVNSALENNNGKSIISYKSHELMLDTNGVQKLTQNFYIADFCNAELGGEDGEANFVGGGVLYYAVDKTTGKATKATANSKGEASESTLRSAVENVVNGNYTSDLAKDTADSASKITCRYKKLEGNEGIYKFSSDLQAYQYIYSSTMTNNKAYENYTYRVYSYFVYEVNGEYHISVSDSYADADFYVAE